MCNRRAWCIAGPQPVRSRKFCRFVVAPSVAVTIEGNGRWLAQSSTVTYGPNKYRPLHRERTGYYNTVQAWQGADDEALERIRGQRPALLIKWLSDSAELKGYAHGTIYQTEYKFLLHVIANNLRDDESAVLGSTVETDSEVTPAPGLLRMLGDLRYMLSGSQLGLEPGVMFVDASGKPRSLMRTTHNGCLRQNWKLSCGPVCKSSMRTWKQIPKFGSSASTLEPCRVSPSTRETTSRAAIDLRRSLVFQLHQAQAQRTSEECW